MPLLQLRGVTKRFGGVAALNDVDFNLFRGEIHALLGENGAGKSTLIKVLGGIHAPDAGEILIDGQPAGIHSVAAADRRGIRIIHQEMSLAPNLTVAENIYLGREPTRLGLVQRRAMVAQAEQLVASLGLDEIRNVRAIVGQLRMAHQQLVEIARALSCQARILVLDEPTSSLSDAETEALFATLQRLRSQGVGMIYISHRLEEIIRLADRITVLRDGRSVGTQSASQLSHRQLVTWMVGREIADHFRRPQSTIGPPVLEVCGLCAARVHDVSLTVHQGEILGIAGLVGAGRSELARAIFGIDPVQGGSVRVAGQAVVDPRPARCDSRRRRIGAGRPSARRTGHVARDGLQHRTALGRGLDPLWPAQRAPAALDRASDHRAVRDQAVGPRAVDGEPVRRQSTEGARGPVDGTSAASADPGRADSRRRCGAREEMFAIISSLVESGLAVLLISSDLAEVIGMSHRIAVYRDGRVLDVIPREKASLVDIMGKLTGATTA